MSRGLQVLRYKVEGVWHLWYGNLEGDWSRTSDLGFAVHLGNVKEWGLYWCL